MAQKLSDRELEALLAPYLEYEGKRLVHFVSQKTYRLSDVHLRESDLTVWFTYAAVGSRVKFSRPIGELLDGRWVIGDFGLIDGDLAHI